MPELPEVETIRRDLQLVVLGKKICRLDILRPSMIKGNIKLFRETLVGNRFERISRRGKLLLFELANNDRFLLLHLKMTGQLICQIPDGLVVGGHTTENIFDLPNEHTRLVFYFTDQTTLYFNDLRAFGYVQLVDVIGKNNVLKKFGLEPLTPEFTFANFFALISGRRTSLKAFLLNQRLVAGIGNIYADEICFQAKLSPWRKVDGLLKSEITSLFNACRSVLVKAVEKRGTTFSDFVDVSGKKGGYSKYLKVFGRQGKPCLNCNTNISKVRYVGRGTHFCPQCQI